MSGSDSKAAAAAAVVTTDIDMMARRCVTPIPQRIGFIGSGKMAMALAKGFMADGLVSPSQVVLVDFSGNYNKLISYI